MKTNRKALHGFLKATVLGVLVSSVAGAGEEPPAILQTEPAPVSDGDWQVSLSPYLWMAGVEGVTGVGNVLAPVDVGFGDVVESLDMGLLAAAEVRKGRWGFLSNLTWMKLSAEKDGGGLLFDDVDVDMTQTLLDVRIAYRVLEGRTSLDLVAGARYMGLDTEASFDGGTLDGADFEVEQDWVDPLVGIHLIQQINEKWIAVLRADIGGFGVSSEQVWEAFGGLGYQLNDRVLLFAGYRHLDVDYSRSFTFDAEMSGAVIGTKFSF